MNEKRLQDITEIQKDFVYDKFVAGDYTIYHCHKPGTSTYSFEILLGKMGIYVGGDIDSLSYRVARGIEFLSGNDIDYYQHSKLEHIYMDKKELDKDALKIYLRDLLWEKAVVQDEDGVEVTCPETLEKVVEYYRSHELDKDVWSYRGEDKPHNDAWGLYENIVDCDDLQEIYRTIYNSKCYDGDMPCIDRADDGVMFCMYMVHHAAKKIFEQEKNPATCLIAQFVEREGEEMGG